MMDDIERLRRYAGKSARPLPPQIDVAADVLATLRSNQPTAPTTRPLLAVAAVVWMVAAFVSVLGTQALSELQDPLGSLLSPLVVSLQ